MKIIYDTAAFTGHKAVVALGMFDGVHIGHQALIRRTVALAKELEAQSVVCTFDRHPLSVLRPDAAPAPLLSLDENLARFARLGADAALVGGELHLWRKRQGRRGVDSRYGAYAGLSGGDRAPGDGRRCDVLVHPDTTAAGVGGDRACPASAAHRIKDISDLNSI